MHYYQFNIGDYSSHTSRLSLMEDLAYRRLLDLYYLTEHPFNECLTSVAREIGMPEHKNEIEYILNKFFILSNGFWVQGRADLEIKTYQSKRKQQSKAGKASAEARKTKASEQTSNDRSTDVQPNIKHKPLNTKHIKDLSDITDGFDHWWNIYPKKSGKKKTLAKFIVLTKKLNNDQFCEFVDKISYDSGKRFKDTEKQFVIDPCKYLNGERWNDEY